MKDFIKLFNLTIKEREERYLELFGIVIPKNVDLKFTNVKKDLIKHVTKNKDKFIKVVDDQLKKFNKLIKK
jgi:hypothetical protein